MKFDKLSLFADGLEIPTSANTVTYSKVMDFRKCNLIDGCLKLFATVVGTVNATGSVTTNLQVSDDATTWTSIASFTQNGSLLGAAFLPIVGKKRFARLTFSVGGTALGSAITVKAGLVDQFEVTELPATQSYPPLEDLTVLGDKVETALVVAESAKTITKGSNADIAVSGGYICDKVVPTKYTLTITQGSKVNIALAADAADGNVILIDGLGNKHTIAVTAGS